MTDTGSSHSDFVTTIRMTREHVVSEPADFVRHLYRTVLLRDPEFDPDTNPPVPLPAAGNVLERCTYFFSVVLSQESLEFKNKEYDELLGNFFSALGYINSNSILVELMKDFAPTLLSFKEKSSILADIISTNTQRTFFGIGTTEDIFNELDGVLSLKEMSRLLSSVLENVATFKQDLDHITWSLKGLKDTMTQGTEGTLAKESSSKDEYTLGLLRAILARLELQDAS